MGQIRGECPRGCGETLIIADDEAVWCSNPTCPQPRAAQTLLDRSPQFLPFIRDDYELLREQDAATKTDT